MHDDECNVLFLCNRQGKIRKYIYIRLQMHMEMFPSQAKNGRVCGQPNVKVGGFLHSESSAVRQACCVQRPRATPRGPRATWQHEEPMRTPSHMPAVPLQALRPYLIVVCFPLVPVNKWQACLLAAGRARS